MAEPTRRLLDQFGNPVTREMLNTLGQEISTTNAAHARPPFSGNLAFGITPARMGAIIRAADNGNSMEWMILAEEIEELFPHYAATLGKRKRQVAQLPVSVVAADIEGGHEHADFVRDWIGEGVLHRALFDITDAIGKGYSVAEIIWDSQPGRVTPKDILYRPQRFFELSYQDATTIWLRTEEGFKDLLDHKFLVHRHPAKSGNIVRSSLTRMVAWLFMYAAYNAADWGEFVTTYGSPIRVGRYGPEASETDKKVLWRAVSSIAGDVAAIVPRSMEIEFVKDGDRVGGSTLYEKRADWLNREVSKLVLGGTAGIEAINGGHAVGQEHRASEDDVEKFDGTLLGTTFTRQLAQTMVAFTFGPQTKYPVIQVGEPPKVPLKDLVESIADLGGMGLKVKASEIRDRLQLTEPGPEDETIGGTPPPPVPRPDIPRPPKRLPSDGFSQAPFLGRLIARHSDTTPEVLEALTDRLAADAAGALHGLTETVRMAFEQATDLHDLALRIHKLKLPPGQYAEAMARGMALAHLAGQADLVAEIRQERH